MRARSPSERPAAFDISPFSSGPPTCWPPGM
jgi:hypothetical protein